MDALLQDLRYAIRSLAQSPGFTAVVVLTLAFGIGGTAAVFSALDAAMLRPLPYPEPDRLVVLDVTVTWSGQSTDSIGWSYPKFETMHGATSMLEHVVARAGRDVTLAGGAEPVRLSAEAVSPAYFALLGARAAIGRVLVDGDDAETTASVVVLSHVTWRSVFGGDSAVLGRTVRLNGVPAVVVGVAQPSFRGLDGTAAAWVPVHALPRLTFPGALDQRWAHEFSSFARLKPNVTLAQARAEMATIGRIVDEAHPMPGGGASWGTALTPLDAARVHRPGRTVLFVLAGAAGLVLLLVCVNVASMLLARAVAREREIVIRSALGAGRRRLVQQLLTEALVLAVAGGAAGLGIAVWGLELLRATIPDSVSSHGVAFLRADALRLELGSVAFTGAVAIAAGLLAGLVPAWRLSRPDAAATLRAGASQGRGLGSLRRMTLRGGLVAAQVALAAVLLAGAGLMLRTLAELAAVRLGFEAEGVLSVRYAVPPAHTTLRDPALFHAAVLERFRAIPGARDVAMSGCAPLAGCVSIPFVSRIDGRPPFSESDAPSVRMHHVSDDYFRLLGVPLLQGRTFDARDQATSLPVIVLSVTAARKIYGTLSAVGRQIAPTVDPFNEHMGTVIGIVPDVKQLRVQEEPQPDIYVSLRQAPFNELTVLMRTAGDPLALLPATRAAMRELAPDVPLYDVKPLPRLVRDATARERLISISLTAFAVLGLVLAALGVYGVLAFSVAQRTHEVGVRMALGARAADVVRLVARQGLVMVAVGLGAGGALALIMTRMLRGLLFGVAPSDPLTLVGVLALLVVVAIAAAVLPVSRATRVDPIVALRYE